MTVALVISLFVAAVVVGSALAYGFAHRVFRRKLSELGDSTTRQVKLLSDAVTRLEADVARVTRLVPSEPTAAVEAAPASQVPASAADDTQQNKAQEIAPDTLVILAAAVTAFLGKKVRIRSAKMLGTPYEIVNPWAQQGRVIVQASHNLRPRS